MFYGDLEAGFSRYSRRARLHLEEVRLYATSRQFPNWLACIGSRQFYLATLLFRNLNHFIPASEAAENVDLALGNAEMLCQ